MVDQVELVEHVARAIRDAAVDYGIVLHAKTGPKLARAALEAAHHAELVEAASAVLDGLNERIDDACASESHNVPVFRGIAALSDALAKLPHPNNTGEV